MSKYYYIDASFSSEQSKLTIDVKFIVISKFIHLKQCPINLAKRAMIEEVLPPIPHDVKYQMSVHRRQEIDLSEYQNTDKSKLPTITIAPIEKR
ncbi:MAG: hypothetical protein ACKUBY_01860 [Candidatus Moraniibacteriota bacterium]|jgi:hypothetical protein